MNPFKFSTIVASTVLVLAGCSSTVKLDEKPAVTDSKPATVVQPQAAVETQREIKPVETKVVDPLDDPKGALAQRSVYFDYDSYVVREDGKPVVGAHSGYLNNKKARKIIIQGNTDERGGNEYNLALGQKRAEAVRKSMAALGVAESQMEAVSLGKTKPKAMGSNEEAWAQNRRADIVY